MPARRIFADAPAPKTTRSKPATTKAAKPAKTKKVASAVPAIVVAPAAKRPTWKTYNAPHGGWRTPTLRDEKIIDLIKEEPGLTSREYGDRLGLFTTAVNDAILMTVEARELAEAGAIALPMRGANPLWVNRIVNKDRLVRRQRVNQFPQLSLSRKVTGENRESLETISALVGRLQQHVSPLILGTIQSEINDTLAETGKQRARELAQLKSLTA